MESTNELLIENKERAVKDTGRCSVAMKGEAVVHVDCVLCNELFLVHNESSVGEEGPALKVYPLCSY